MHKSYPNTQVKFFSNSLTINFSINRIASCYIIEFFFLFLNHICMVKFSFSQCVIRSIILYFLPFPKWAFQQKISNSKMIALWFWKLFYDDRCKKNYVSPLNSQFIPLQTTYWHWTPNIDLLSHKWTLYPLNLQFWKKVYCNWRHWGKIWKIKNANSGEFIIIL